MRKMIFHFSNASFGITDYLQGVKDMAAIEVKGASQSLCKPPN